MGALDRSAAVQEYYGQVLQGAGDLRTGARCSSASLPARHQEILAKVAPEVLDRFYGCGSPIPDCLDGATVLDLGCGTGRDSYLVSALVGPAGRPGLQDQRIGGPV